MARPQGEDLGQAAGFTGKLDGASIAQIQKRPRVQLQEWVK